MILKALPLLLLASIGQFRGYEDVSSVLRQRLLDPAHEASDRFELGVFLGTRDPESLPALLGGFSGTGGDNAYRNGKPNAMNTALWYLVAERISQQLAAQCREPGAVFADEYRLDEGFQLIVTQLCAWPATTPEALAAYWDRIMGRFAPDEEREAWVAFMETQRDQQPSPQTGARLVKTASETILLDPYFLLND